MDFVKKQSVESEISKGINTYNKNVLVEYDGELKVYREGASFPIKSAPSSDALWSVNLIKKTIIESIKVLNSYQFYPFFVTFILTPKKKFLTKVLNSFNRIGYGAMSPYLYYKNFSPDKKLDLLKVSRAMGKFSELFLVYYGIDKNTAHQTAELIAHVIEFDGAYRYRLLDIMSESDFEKLANNPRKEVQRLIQVWYDREREIPTYIRPKLEILRKLAWILEMPSIKKAFREALRWIKKEDFEIDEIDFYQLLQRVDYWHFGRSPKENMDILLKKGYKLPTVYDA